MSPVTSHQYHQNQVYEAKDNQRRSSKPKPKRQSEEPYQQQYMYNQAYSYVPHNTAQHVSGPPLYISAQVPMYNTQQPVYYPQMYIPMQMPPPVLEASSMQGQVEQHPPPIMENIPVEQPLPPPPVVQTQPPAIMAQPEPVMIPQKPVTTSEPPPPAPVIPPVMTQPPVNQAPPPPVQQPPQATPVVSQPPITQAPVVEQQFTEPERETKIDIPMTPPAEKTIEVSSNRFKLDDVKAALPPFKKTEVSPPVEVKQESVVEPEEETVVATPPKPVMKSWASIVQSNQASPLQENANTGSNKPLARVSPFTPSSGPGGAAESPLAKTKAQMTQQDHMMDDPALYRLGGKLSLFDIIYFLVF